MGPFPKVAGNKKYLLVDTDYFTKWVELNPWQTLEMWTPKNLFGRILSLSLEFLIPLSQIMGFNLIVKPLGGTAAIWE